MASDNERLNLLLDLRRYADAEKAARDAIGRNPQWAAGYTHLARALMGLNRKDDAIEAAREGARKAPLDAWAVGTYACALNWFGQTKEALEPIEEALRLDPRYVWAFAMISNILFNLNRFKEAREKAMEGLRLEPNNESLIRWKGWAEHKLGEAAEARRTANDGLKHYPNSHLLFNLLGCIRWTEAEKLWGLKRLRAHREADTLIRDAIRLDPVQVAYRDNLNGNATSCREHVVPNVLRLAFVLFSFLPVCIATLVRYSHLKNYHIFNILFLSLIAASALCAFSGTTRCWLAAPLSRFRVPAAPQEPADERRGRREFYTCVAMLFVPYLLFLAFGCNWLW
jgi:tetratricopeptide (TPR) repeat protein